MKRITITLTPEEYAALERHAADERRSVRDMAAYLVTKHTPPLSILASGSITIGNPFITTSGTLDVTGGSGVRLLN